MASIGSAVYDRERYGTTAPTTTTPQIDLHYEVDRTGPVLMRVYDANGSRVRTLIHSLQYPGRYLVSWDGLDDYGRRMRPGTYLCRLAVGGRLRSERTIHLD